MRFVINIERVRKKRKFLFYLGLEIMFGESYLNFCPKMVKVKYKNFSIKVKEEWYEKNQNKRWLTFYRKQQIILPVSESRSSFLDGLMVKGSLRFMDDFSFTSLPTSLRSIFGVLL